MATTRTKQTLIEKATNKTLGLATKANDFALDATEKAFNTSFMVANKSLEVTNKVIKKGLDITATQQDLVFDVLQGIKKRILSN